MRDLEHRAQAAVISWASMMYTQCPDLELLYAVPNGGKRSKAQAGKLRAEGVKPGVPDLCLPVPRLQFHGLYIEMKIGKGRPSAEQRRWLTRLGLQGYATSVCFGAEEGIACLTKYLNLPNPTNTEWPPKLPRPSMSITTF